MTGQETEAKGHNLGHIYTRTPSDNTSRDIKTESEEKKKKGDEQEYGGKYDGKRKKKITR